MKLIPARKYLCMLFGLAFLWLSGVAPVHAQVQQKKWYTRGKAIDFQTVPPTVSDMPAGPLFMQSQSATNGHYGPSGDLLLFVSGNGIYNKYGALITTIADADFDFDHNFLTQQKSIGKQVIIVPNPRDCSRYFVIYEMAYNYTNLAVLYRRSNILYTVIDLSANNMNGGVLEVDGIPQKDVLLNVFEGEMPEIAYADTYSTFVVGKKDIDAHNLYVARQVSSNFPGPQQYSSQLYKFRITSLGISFQEELFQTTQFGLASLDMDLSHDGTLLAVGCSREYSYNFSNQSVDVALFHLDASGNLNTSEGNFLPGLSTIDIPGNAFTQSISGIEFTPDNQRLFIGVKNDRIYYVQVSNLNTIQEVFFSKDFTNSQMELAYNGKIYLTNNQNRLDYIEWQLVVPEIIISKSDQFHINFSFSAIPNYSTSGAFNKKIFLLPMQIDGQDYEDFFDSHTPICSEHDINN